MFRHLHSSFLTQCNPVAKLSPRAYIPYDCSSSPEPGYFREGIYNSFPEENVRVSFLNKFYQCLLAHKIPHKTRKLVVAGPRDSGKTSWAYVFHRIIPPQYIASITNERQFSAAMIHDDTQLVIIDEWSASTMTSDLAKTILQGGWVVTAVKHAPPKQINCHSPFYITTNNVPDFRDENENVERRIHVFNTSSLSTITPGIDQWIFNNAMDCVAWIAHKLNSHRDLIPPEERWYEDEEALNSVVPSSVDGITLWKRENIIQISEADLNPQQPANAPLIHDTIHEGFITEARRRLLARKRRRRWQIRSSDSSSEEDAGKTTCVHEESDISSETLEPTQAITTANEEIDTPSKTSGQGTITPAHNEITASSQSSGEWAITPANDEIHASSQSSVEWAITPANDEIHASSQISGEQTSPPTNHEMQASPQTPQQQVVLPANKENHKCSQTSAERVIPPTNNEIQASPQATGKQAIPPRDDQIQQSPQTPKQRAIPPVNDEIPPASNTSQSSEIRIVPPSNTTSEVCNPDQPSTSTGITHAPVSEGIGDSPNTWTLNDGTYMARVAALIRFNLNKNLERGHVHAFTERVRKAKMMRDVHERAFWVKADPDIDAWMLATGRK